MALQSPFFGKREPETPAARTMPPTPTGRTVPVTMASTPSPPAANEASPAAEPSKNTRPGADSLLKVGPLIRLKGVEITDCDTLFVEGTVEATMDSRVMEIAPPGRFKGAAEIDIAEIHGHFEGTLTVRDRLVIHPTGRVTGTVRYGKLSIAEGGQLSGDVGLLDTPATPTTRVTTPTA
ncbi:MAG: polymer-forming cytoskeletal protein [Thiobacillus sp.]|uniref:bactofilin family protein n=1 Tax=Thiobacillus sp. TaxID=924 RepID=UPI002733D0A6|nr:polymer-forming cytoskeletal protein [Thiobacillus sp.]MDP3584207.1 polymer-forming cytoskeletal protein [Thiobacillus sp.]